MTLKVAPDLAHAALEGDLINACENIAKGDTLQAGKRKIFEDVVIGGATPEEIQQLRRISLLRKYAEGGRLNPDELDEIADLIPDDEPEPPSYEAETMPVEDFAALAPFVAPAQQAPQEPDAYALEVEAVVETPQKPTLATGYRFPYKHYESVYGKKERTVLWWLKQGREKEGGEDLPPLDDPQAMPAWWGRVMKQRCPDAILAASRAAHAEAASRSPQAATASTPPIPDSMPGPPPSSAGSTAPTPGAGFEDTLRDLRAQVALAYRELTSLQSAPVKDHAAIEQARRRWMQLQEAAQKAEAKAPDLFEKTGRLIDRDLVAQELATMLGNVAQGIRSLRRRLQPKLRTVKDEAEADSIWQNGCDELFEDLRRSGYAAPFQLEAAA